MASAVTREAARPPEVGNITSGSLVIRVKCFVENQKWALLVTEAPMTKQSLSLK